MKKLLPLLKKIPMGLFAIILVSLLFRLLFLDRIPTGINNDELSFIIHAKAVFLTGKDISGIWSPFSLSPVTGESPKSEIPYLIMAPFIGLLPFSLLLSKLPYVLISTLLVVLLYLITSKIINRQAAFFVGLVGALNPWSIFFGRTAYEAPLAIFFYLLAFYILIIARSWKILFAFIPLFIGFYSYMGTKIIFIPYVFFIIFYAWYVLNQKKYLKQYALLFLVCLSLFTYFLFSVQHQSTKARLSELSTPTNPAYATLVNEERRLSIQTPLTNLFSNKFVAFGKDSIDKYLRVFSTQFLFSDGVDRSSFSLWYHGYFYYLDFFFILIGFCILFAKKRPLWLLFSGLILIAPLPSVASNMENGFAALRSSLLYPLLMILIGLGIWHVLYLSKRKWYIITISSLLIFLYTLQVLNFVNVYFLRYPLYNSEAYRFSLRIVSKYTQFAAENNKKVVVISDTPKGNFYHYLFDTNIYDKNTAEKVKKLIQQNTYEYNNVKFIQCPNTLNLPADAIIINDTSKKCRNYNPEAFEYYLTIPRLSDGGALFRIVNDTVCNKYTLGRFPHNISFSDFAIENLSEKRFCEKFITDIR